MDRNKPQHLTGNGLGKVAWSQLITPFMPLLIPTDLTAPQRRESKAIHKPWASLPWLGQLVKDNCLYHMVRSCICHHERLSMWCVNLSGRMRNLKGSFRPRLTSLFHFDLACLSCFIYNGCLRKAVTGSVSQFTYESVLIQFSWQHCKYPDYEWNN